MVDSCFAYTANGSVDAGTVAPEVKIPILMIFLFELLFYRSVKIEKEKKIEMPINKIIFAV